jgi:hypothetical protein
MKNIFGFCFLMLLFASCKKEVTELPEATGTGANTFGASVNGKLWKPAGFGIVPTAQILEAHYEPGRAIMISARNFASSPKESEFTIRLAGVVKPGVYPLTGDSENWAYYVERKITPTGEWRTNGQYNGSVTITTTDTVNRIISGTFAFQAASLYNEAPLTVTDGRFDIRVD